MIRKVGHLEIYINKNNEVIIFDNDLENAVCFDECMAEKLCRMILDVAKEIREAE